MYCICSLNSSTVLWDNYIIILLINIVHNKNRTPRAFIMHWNHSIHVSHLVIFSKKCKILLRWSLTSYWHLLVCMHEVCSLTVMYKVFMFCCAFVLLTRISLVVIPAALHQSSLSSLLPLLMMCVHVGWRFLWDGFFYCHVFTLAVWTPTMAFFVALLPQAQLVLLFYYLVWIGGLHTCWIISSL